MQRIALLAVAALVALFGVACGAEKKQEGHRLVSPAEFAKAMAEPGVVTLNVLGPNAPSIPGTDLAIPVDELSSGNSKLPPTSTKLAVYCWSGHTSAVAVPVLERLGYTNIVELEGGMQAWQADGRRLIVFTPSG
jgi:rhodanese-related sulfurtransferase